MKLSAFSFLFFALAASLPAANLMVGGLERSYFLETPDGRGPWPVIIALHGGGGKASQMEKLTGLGALGKREGFAVAYPEAKDKHWNDGRTDFKGESQADDAAFLMALRAKLVAEQLADPARIYLCGISNGGMMSLRMACEHSDAFAAVGVVAMNMSAAFDCAPQGPVPICFIKGDEDPLVPQDGGEIRLFKHGRARGKVRSFDESLAFWAKVNHCDLQPEISLLPDKDPSDGCRVESWNYEPSKDGVELKAFLIKGGGHAWPGGWKYLPDFLVGRRSMDIDASAELWGFFRLYLARLEKFE